MESNKRVKQSLGIKLVSIRFYKCSWQILKVFDSGLAQSVNKTLSKPRDSSKFPPLKTCWAHPVSQAGITKIDQLAENLRQREVSTPLLGSNLEESLQCRCVGYGVLIIIRLLLQGLKIQCRFWVLQSEIGQSILRQGGKDLIIKGVCVASFIKIN